MRMGYLGPAGTHSEAAARFLLGQQSVSAELVPFADIYAAMSATTSGQVDTCLVPVENSLEGAINITLDTLAGGNRLVVEREFVWAVHNQLLGRGEASQAQTIYSHPQPFSQCREWLRRHCPKARLVETASTAAAARFAAQADPGARVAAIGTERAAELYGLAVLARDIEDNPHNYTRFYELRHAEPQRLPDGRTGKALVICDLDGSKPGALYSVLGEFAGRGINLSRIESRPCRTQFGEYLFFFDLIVEPGNRAALRESIDAVRRRCLWLRDLGEFPVSASEPVNGLSC